MQNADLYQASQRDKSQFVTERKRLNGELLCGSAGKGLTLHGRNYGLLRGEYIIHRLKTSYILLDCSL